MPAATTASLSDFLIRYQFLTRRSDAKFFDDAGSTWVRIDGSLHAGIGKNKLWDEWADLPADDKDGLYAAAGAIIHTDPDGNKSATAYGSKDALMAAWREVAA